MTEQDPIQTNEDHQDASLKTLLERRIAYFMSPLESFIHKQTTAGIFLIVFSVAALLISNSPYKTLLEQLSLLKLGLLIGRFEFSLSFGDCISHGLMALFFFLTGLEIKREILAGKLRHFKEISLITIAALGGILVPAIFYYALNFQGAGQHGWGIPTATDTAFAIGILALLASRVSIGMTVFLTALAIFDDIGAIIVISIFYAHEMNTIALTLCLIVMVVLFLANRSGMRNGWFYCGMGMILWGCVLKAGIHPTFAGLLLALFIPARATISPSGFISNMRKLLFKLEESQEGAVILESNEQHSIVSDIAHGTKAASTPLQRWETWMVTPIVVIVLPLFSLLNAGFLISEDLLAQGLQSAVTWGIIGGLLIGKPAGILAFSYAAIKAGVGRLPAGMTWVEVVGVSLLAGIGFTMSIFFTTLSFPNDPELIEQAKLGILISSIFSAIIGSAWIFLFSRQSKKAGIF